MAECSTVYKVKDKCLLLVGRTGSGKSSTANSLIGEKLFSTRYDDFDFGIIKKKTVNIYGSNVTVVDATGIGDTGYDMNGDIHDTIKKAETAVQLCESGFNALIFVMTYGTRFTRQEKDAVDLIKSLFGRDIFRRFGIIVMTRGDHFDTDTEDDHKTFDQWCEEITGDQKIFFQECDNRIVIFNNRSFNIDTLITQRQKLLTLVSDTSKYTLEDFNQAINDRQKLLGHSVLEAERQNKYLLQDIDKHLIRFTATKETKQRYKMLTNILSDLHKQMETIKTTFEGSEYYNSLWTPLETIFLKVRSQLRIIEGGRSVNAGSENEIKRQRNDETNCQPYRSLPVPSRTISNTILPLDNKSTTIHGPHYSHSPQTLAPANHPDRDLVLLLVGRKWSGKSSTANCIIGRKLFGKKGEDSSLLQKYAVDIEGLKITVVDGTGIGDTGSDMNGDLQDIIRKAENAVQLCESGFNALIFVMTYGTTFNKQEKDAVDLIKSLFGRDIFRRFGIIVITRGDQFERVMEIDDIPFDQWLMSQTGDIKTLFDECQFRCVLFDNITRDRQILSKQRGRLLSLISNYNKYTLEDFQEKNKCLRDLILDTKFLERKKQNKKFVTTIEKRLKDINPEDESENQKALLKEIGLQLQKQIKDIEHEFKDSIYLQTLLTTLHVTELNIASKLQLLDSRTLQSKDYSLVTDDQSYIRNKQPKTVTTTQISLTLSHERENDGAQQRNGRFRDMTTTTQDKLLEAHQVNSDTGHDKVIVLVGRTGNGKSSTANCIVGERFFISIKDDLTIKKMTFEYKGSKVTVVDGTSIGDTGSDMNGDLQDTIQKAETAVKLCESGFNALIFVMTYGTKFTKQEKDAVDLIKSLFGRDIFRRFGIIVMTHGDQFERDTEDDHKTFDQWCKERNGDQKFLFQECDYRIVIFNNRSSNIDTLNRQRQNLLNLVSHTIKYTLEDFNQASNDSQKLLIGHSFLEADKKNKNFLQDIHQQIILVMSTKESKRRHKMLTNIQSDLQKQMETVQKTFQGSDYYNFLSTPLETRHLNVRSQLRKKEDVLVKKYAFFLVGRSGNGKSSTGNSIFGQTVFITRKPHDSSNGDVICHHSALVDERSVFVVDGTGIGDTGDDINGGVDELLESVDFTMRNEMSKFNAIILVYFIHERSNVRMTSSILAIKSILGPNVFKNWGIIVVTFGDQFDYSEENDKIHSFEDWCQQQTGYFKILLEECNNRCVLFDNKTTDKNKQMEQRNKLISVVDSMTYKKYTIDDFDSPICMLCRGHLKIIEEVNLKSESFNGNMTSQYEANKHDLEQLIVKLLEHTQRLAKQDQEPEFTRQLLYQVTETATKLQLKIQYCFMEEDYTIAKLFKDFSLIAKEPPSSQSHFQLAPTKDELKTSKLSTSAIQDNKIFITKDSLQTPEETETVYIRTSIDIDGPKESTKKRTQIPKTIDKRTQMPTVLLVGRSGNGKSSVGNSILGEHKFKLMSIPESQHAHNEVSTNVKVRVVDCTGIAESIYEMLDDVKSVIQSAREAVQLCDPGFDALIYLLKYGVRFTKQEKDAIQMVKSIFGENVLRDWGILVFSYGDNLYMDTEDDGITFQDWCREQTGDIKDLFQEVDYRCFTFDNKTRDAEKQRKQREELMRCVEKIQDNKRRCYSLSDFESREVLTVGEEVDQLKAKTEEIIRKIRIMNQLLKRKPIPRDHEIQLETVLQELQRHAHELKEKDRNTGILKSLHTQVQGEVTMLQSQIKLLKPKTGGVTVPTTDDVLAAKLDLSRKPINTAKKMGSFFFKSFRQ